MSSMNFETGPSAGEANTVHDCHVDRASEMKFNGGNPVYLCDTCRKIVCYAEYDARWNEWTPGRPYL